jgi:hypothetical protein
VPTTTPAPRTAIAQQAKLVGGSAIGQSWQGWSSAVSGDGNTVVIGGFNDDSAIAADSNKGAAWIFTRTGSTWDTVGTKLISNDSVRYSTNAIRAGNSVAISRDGNTVAVGAPGDNRIGAVTIWVKTGSTWAQQGTKLVGTGSVLLNAAGNYTGCEQGSSVALSSDGNTLAVGASYDDDFRGAVWIWTRSGTTWTQQTKLVAPDSSSGDNSRQGSAIAITDDGNTLVVGASPGPSTGGLAIGGAYVWVRSGSTWSLQGSKLVGSGNTGGSQQGRSVAISNDSNTIAVGGIWDDSLRGAVWIFTKSGTTWAQQGSKLVSTGAGDPGANGTQGTAVALSTNGNTLIVGAGDDSSTLVYTRTGTSWSRLGPKQVGTGAIGSSRQGNSVALSSDSTTLVIGGAGDDNFVGATWIFYLT